MAGKMRDALRLWRLYALMDLRWLMQDLSSALLVMLSETLSNLSSMAGILLLAVRFGGVGGLGADEVLFMLGFFELADGIGWMLFGNYNVMHISRRIGRGQVDHMLMQPRPMWMQLFAEGAMPFSGCAGAIIGAVLTGLAMVRLGIGLSPLWALTMAFYLLIHMTLRLSRAALFGAMAFRWPLACEEISTMVIDLDNQLGKFPLAGLPPVAGILLHTVFPIGLLGYLPALSLLRDLGFEVEIGLPFLVAALFASAAIIAMKKGLTWYETHSCCRYKEMGHRC